MDYSNVLDEELCALAKKGDAEAISKLIDRYKSYIVKLSRNYFINGGDFNDLYQEGIIGLINAVYHFENNGTFKPYAIISIKNNIYSAIRKSKNKNNIPLAEYIPLFTSDANFDDDKNSLALSIDNPENEIINKENVEELTSKIKKSLSKMENEILSLYLSGYSYADISDKLNKNVKSIDNAIQRIRNKIRGIV